MAYFRYLGYLNCLAYILELFGLRKVLNLPEVLGLLELLGLLVPLSFAVRLVLGVLVYLEVKNSNKNTAEFLTLSLCVICCIFVAFLSVSERFHGVFVTGCSLYRGKQ